MFDTFTTEQLKHALELAHEDLDILVDRVFLDRGGADGEYLLNRTCGIALHTECGRVLAYDEDPPMCRACYNDRCLRCNEPINNLAAASGDAGTLCATCWEYVEGRD
jgi:hypothetical protein